jgi:protein tyrosine phosphatase
MVREAVKNKSAPILVHCSAGVGRTGTYIAVDLMIWRQRNRKDIVVKNLVTFLRRQRMKMVQNVEQYRFLFACAGEIKETIQPCNVD